MDHSDENLLLRWSRRKHQARQTEIRQTVPPKPLETVPEQPVKVAAIESAEDQKPAESQASSTEPVCIEDLPDIETLTYESDYSAFMREGVPEFLKKQALRKLWVSNPLLAVLDGLNDYDPINMKFLERLEGTTEPLAEMGRSLRDKIMQDKRARNDRPRGPRRPIGERRRDFRTAQQDVRGQAAEDETNRAAGAAAAPASSKPPES